MDVDVCTFETQTPLILAAEKVLHLQYDGSNHDLDWRIDFRHLNFVCMIQYLRSKVIKGCFIE